MAKRIGERIPAELLAALGEAALVAERQAGYLLSTSGEDGEPRIAMVGLGEVYAPDDRRLRFALWPGTSTGRNLRSGRPVLFSAIAPDLVYYLRGTPAEIAAPDGVELDFFEMTVTSVESDAHPGMPVTSGITFEVTGDQETTAGVLADWRRQRELLAAVRP
jgi:hypothetical protein